MIDAGLVLADKEFVKREVAKKRFDTSIIDSLEGVLLEIRSLKTALNELNRRRNAWNRDASIPVGEKRELRENISDHEKRLNEAIIRSDELINVVPNIPDPDAPIGKDESGNVVVFESSDHYECATADPAPHWDVAGRLGILDTELAGKMAGSRFALFKGGGAKLLRALVNYGFALHGEKYFEILPPHLVSTKSLTYTGHLPKFAEEQYKCANDDLWLIPTAEVPLTAAFADTVFPAGALPKYCMGYTLAFRREAGSTGKDTRGLQRIHEFHKVELLKIAEPSMVGRELDDLLEDCLKIVRDLKLKYRVVDLCTGEMGDKYARCFDIEVYSPGVKKWLEVSSVGHFSDYQSRRAGIRYVNEKGKKKLADTLNGAGVATPRLWAAITETYQQPDGSVKIPQALIPFIGCDTL
ncbi:MAG: serine--tRNA ligase [Oscillospiraceae bacterium]|jgi:seryl-tRNA synthetase|nr:serine--tRNA ligase [Oscillospiraceae bacterium]